MARYLVTQRLAGRESAAERITFGALRAGLSGLSSFASFMAQPEQLEAQDKTIETLVVEGDPEELRGRQDSNVILEEEKPRRLALAHPLAATFPWASEVPAGLGAGLDLTLSCNGAPLDGALIIMVVGAFRGFMTSVTAVTDASGHAVVPYDPRFFMPVSLTLNPRSRAWSVISPVTGPKMTLSLPPLPRTGQLGWWHRALGLNKYSDRLGEGIRVGVIDTGIAAHPNLANVESAGAFLGGQHITTPDAGSDVDGHGTHVAGIIAAKPADSRDFAGIAPGAELVSARVYPGGGPPGMESGSATNGDIAQAILTLSRDEKCDIINLSSGGLVHSEIEADRINSALNRGTLVIAAGGNTGGPPLMFPAADPAAVGVSALGMIGGVPFGVLDSFTTPMQPDRYGFGGFFSATFNSIGPELKCTAPGVGIISTVPPQGDEMPYAAMSGTSMAAPVVAGALASILNRDATYRSMPRDRQRSQRAFTLLTQALRSLGMMPFYQGSGIPTLLG
jgi:subtilisin family serine protease